MPKNLNYELGVPSERTMPEFIQEDLLKMIKFYSFACIEIIMNKACEESFHLF